MALAVTLLFWILPKLDPRRSNIELSGKFWNAIVISVVALLALLHTLIILQATGYKIDITNYMLPALSTLITIIGNYMSKTRANWFAGIRTPWTLSSDYSWSKTHRTGGILFMLSGFASLVAWLTLPTKLAFIFLTACVLAASLVSVVLSSWYWRQDPNRV